jgi:hypothetical protein
VTLARWGVIVQMATGEARRTRTPRRPPRIAADHPRYKWVALSNTTLGMLIATINSSIVLISLPAIFNGIRLDPLQPGNVSYRELLGPDRLAALTPAHVHTLTGRQFFPHPISGPFHDGLVVVFALAIVMSLVAAAASLIRGRSGTQN